MKKNLTRLVSVLTAAGLTAGVPMTVVASGFALIEQGVSGLGNAYAGGAAIAEDATTVFFNPAGMTRLADTTTIGALHYINTSAEFTDAGSTDGLAAALTGGDGGDAGGGGIVPNFYYVKNLGNGHAFGLGIGAPFGLSTEYDPDWQGRYHAIESSVMTLNINPAVASKIGDKLSVGAGFNIQYIKGKLTNAIDFSAVCLGSPFAAGCGANGLGVLQGADGLIEIEGDTLSYGYNLGLLFELAENSRIGVAYRSAIQHTLEGDADFTNAPAYLVNSFDAAFAAAGLDFFVDSDVEVGVELPATLSISGYHKASDKIAVMADVTWTNWSVLDGVTVVFDSGQFPSTEEFNWVNTLRYAVGASYDVSDQLVLRGGLAFDETPVRSPEDRGARLPGNDRTWISFGAGFKAGKTLIDVGYAHLIVDDADINNTNATGHTLVGEYEAGVDILSVQATWKF